MNSLKRLEFVLRAKQDPAFFLHEPYFIGDFKPYPLQEEIFVEFFTGGYKEFDAVGGQGGGKSALGSLFIAYDALDLLTRIDPAKDYGLASHSLITQYAIARSIDQAADTIFHEVKERIVSPFFLDYKPRIKDYKITFRKHSDIQICAGGAVSAGSLLGRNVKTVVMDEITSYDETKTQRGAWSVYSRLGKSTNRFGFDGHIIAISMTFHINDIIMTLVRRGKHKPKTMTRAFTTWDMNPTKALDSPEMQAELEKDPATFWRDYGIQPHRSVESYYPNVERINMNEQRLNVLQLPIDKMKNFIDLKQSYVLSGDPAINECAFGLALLHREDDKTICDGLAKLVPKNKIELNPVAVRKLLVGICKVVPVRFFVTDAWFYVEAIEEIKNLGVTVLFKPLRKEEHDETKKAFYEKTFELCNYQPVIEEFQQLLVLDSRRIGVIRGGKIDVVDALTRGYWCVQNHLTFQGFLPHIVEVI